MEHILSRIFLNNKSLLLLYLLVITYN